MSTGRRAYDILRGYVNREWERLQGVEMTEAERELYETYETPGVGVARSTSVDSGVLDEARARDILGVKPQATFAEIREAYERITKRTDPANFPEGSSESQQAALIHRRVHRAYALLTEGMDATEKRFRSLEID